MSRAGWLRLRTWTTPSSGSRQHTFCLSRCPLVDALRASSEPLALPNLARRFHCRSQLHFLRLFQRVFHLRAPLPLSLSLTPTATDLLAVARSPSDAACTLRSLLAIWIPREFEAAA